MRLFPAILVLVLPVGLLPAQAQEATTSQSPEDPARTPTPSDLLEYTQPELPKLSPDGRFVLVETRQADVSKNRYKRSRRILSTIPEEPDPTLKLPEGARSVAWRPGHRQLAYVAPADSNAQVWVADVDGDSARQVTYASESVHSFKFAPSGDRVAYTIRKSPPSRTANDDSTRGKKIDLGTFAAWNLDDLPPSSSPPQTELWVRNLETQTDREVSEDISVDEYSWSPSGERLAITGVPLQRRRKQPDAIWFRRTDLYLYERDRDHLRTIHRGHQDSVHTWEGVVTYSSPFWSPSGRRLGFVRTDWSDRFASTGEVGIHSLESGETRYVTSNASQDLASSWFHWVSADTLYVEYTHHAERGLYRLSLDRGTTHPVFTPDGEAKGFSFSTDGSKAAWIQGSIEQAPEIYVGRPPFEFPRKISSLNDQLHTLQLPNAESVTWTSTDGTEVQGWFLSPNRDEVAKRSPLLVMVHGGPTVTTRNQFSLYSHLWPYPLRVLASRGYAVFIPNYRHSKSFGKEFLRVSGFAQEPVEDILTGIDHLAAENRVDTTRMGILGHSHGGWLGPLVAAERPTFEAAAFAEGIRANLITTYGRGAGWSSRDLTQYYIEETPYENLERAAELSPALRSSYTQNTPTLLEYGKRGALAHDGMELGRALWHQGTPHELIIYPDVRHNIRSPATALESARRTLDWFERWIPAGSTSYAR